LRSSPYSERTVDVESSPEISINLNRAGAFEIDECWFIAIAVTIDNISVNLNGAGAFGKEARSR